MPQDAEFHTHLGWLILAAAGVGALVAFVMAMRGQSSRRTLLVVATIPVLISVIAWSQLWWTPSVPNWIRFEGASYDSTFISPYEPVECQPATWLRTSWKVWPLGSFVGRVANVEGSLDGGGFTADLSAAGSGLPVYRSANEDALPVLVERTARDCYVVFVRDP